MQNFDQAEIHKFDSQANEWWNPQGSFKTLHAINPLRLNFIQQHASLADKKVLDVGCGGGILAEGLARAQANVTGIDLANESLNIAKTHAQQHHLQIDYQVSSVEDFAVTHQQQYDVITCMELLEHVPNPKSIISACANIIKPEGYLFFSTINRNLKAYLFAVIGAEYFLRLLPKGTHDYQKFIQPAELTSWCREAQLQLIDMIGIHYNPLSRRYSLTKDVAVNYIICCRKKI